MITPDACGDPEFVKVLAVLNTLEVTIDTFRQWASMSAMYNDVDNFLYNSFETQNLRLSWNIDNISETDSYWKAFPSRVKELMKQIIQKRTATSTLLERESRVDCKEKQQQDEEIRLVTKNEELRKEEQKLENLRALFEQGHEVFKNISKIYKDSNKIYKDSNKRQKI